MRCEICNRSMTETVLDGFGDAHEYCHHCIDEIQDTLESYDEDDDTFSLWWPEVYPDEEDIEDNLEEEDAGDQGVSTDGGTTF